MLKLGLVFVLSTLFVCGFGKPLGDTINEEVTDTKSFNKDAERSGLAEDSKPFEADSSTKPLESEVNADTKTVSLAEVDRAGKADSVTKAVGERKGSTDFVKEVNEEEISKTGKTNAVNEKSVTRITKTETTNAAEENRTSTADKEDEGRTGKAVEEKSRKREADPINLEKTRRILIGISLDHESDTTAKANLEPLDDETRRFNDGASLEPELNVDEILPTRIGNVEENSAALEENNRRAGTEKFEINVEVDSSRSNKADAVQEKVSADERKANPSTAKVETISKLRSSKDDHPTVGDENFERSGTLENAENTNSVHPRSRINREDTDSKSATPSNKNLEADATVKSGKELVGDELSESRSGAPISSAAEESKTGKKLEEENAEERSDSEPRIGRTTANAESSSDGALELTPELRTGEKSNTDKILEVSQLVTTRMLSDEHKGAEDSRTSLDVAAESENTKEGVSPAGSPADQSRLAVPSHTPLGFPTTVPVPMRRSINTQPSIIITRIPNSDIITLPHISVSANLESSNDIDASENGYTLDGNADERTGDKGTSGTEAEVSLDELPESLLRVNDYADDFNNYNLKSHVGSPTANPEVHYSIPETSSPLASAAPATENSRRNNDDLRSEVETIRNAEANAPNEVSRSDSEFPRKNTRFYPMAQHHANHFTRPGSFVPKYSNYAPQPESFLPKANHYLPEVESSLTTDSVWPKPLVNRLIQATTLANLARYPQQNQFGLFYPYNLYYPRF